MQNCFVFFFKVCVVFLCTIYCVDEASTLHGFPSVEANSSAPSCLTILESVQASGCRVEPMG